MLSQKLCNQGFLHNFDFLPYTVLIMRNCSYKILRSWWYLWYIVWFEKQLKISCIHPIFHLKSKLTSLYSVSLVIPLKEVDSSPTVIDLECFYELHHQALEKIITRQHWYFPDSHHMNPESFFPVSHFFHQGTYLGDFFL